MYFISGWTSLSAGCANVIGDQDDLFLSSEGASEGDLDIGEVE